MIPGLGGLGGGLNPKKMQAVMKKMGIDQDEIPAKEVIIKKEDGSEIQITNPSVTKITMKGQETFQIAGDISEKQGISEEDIKTIIDKTGCSEEKAKKTLKETEDLAESIMKLS